MNRSTQFTRRACSVFLLLAMASGCDSYPHYAVKGTGESRELVIRASASETMSVPLKTHRIPAPSGQSVKSTEISVEEKSGKKAKVTMDAAGNITKVEYHGIEVQAKK